MRNLLTILFCALTASACAEPGYEEIREGRTATVYACGDNWPDFLVDDIVDAIDDWNAKAGPRFGRDLFIFGGIVEDERTYEGGDIGDGRHCIYRVTSETATSDTRALKEEYAKDIALFIDDDDIVVWSDLPPMYLEGWALQATVAHELGHGAGLGHVDENEPTPSVMKSLRHTRLVQPIDIAGFCELRGCP